MNDRPPAPAPSPPVARARRSAKTAGSGDDVSSKPSAPKKKAAKKAAGAPAAASVPASGTAAPVNHMPAAPTQMPPAASMPAASPQPQPQPQRPTQPQPPPARPALRPFDLGEQDLHLFREGTHGRLHRKLGCQLHPGGATFTVWAPNAQAVSVIGDFNGWNVTAHPATPRQDSSGLWQCELDGVVPGLRYKYAVRTRQGAWLEKADPFAFHAELPPDTASVAWSLDGHVWKDEAWMRERGARNALSAPMSVYEVHLGSWRRRHDGTLLDFHSAAVQLAEYLQRTGFTHVELMPIMEHPFYGSWGYQCTGFFAPSARYGTPQEMKALVDTLHQAGIGVILDWVPSHFPNDAHGLYRFDGTALYEHEDPRQGYHPEWNSAIFNYGRNEVRSFLLSSAMYWLDEYHVDGLRVDAVASMLYLDYARRDGEWVPNVHGGRENLEAITFLRLLNESAYRDHPGVQIIAEESTAWPMVSRPTYIGGLGFGLKWNMGWMHDTLQYMAEEPVHRRWHHGRLTFSLVYAFNENFMLPLSHDEVVYGKRSLLERMPGDDWRKFANLRLLFGHMWGHPGKKLLFMGGEFGQRSEWGHDRTLDWWLLDDPRHAGLLRWVEDLNRCYRSTPALYEMDFEHAGFEWIDANDNETSVISYLRRSRSAPPVLVVANFTPVPREQYVVGVPFAGHWVEVLNSDAALYGGAGSGNLGGVDTVPLPAHGRFHSLNLRLPPLGVLFLQPLA
jgi:1,4-alpha-glucan branching enzyme